MEVDEDQWKPRDKLLLVEAVTSGAAGGGSNAGNGNRGDSGGQDGKRDVNWAAVSRLLRKHIPKKRLTTPTSFGSKRCMAMYDTLLARHGVPAGAQSLSASNGALAEGLDRVVAALREEYMHHLRKSIELCDSEIQKSTERMTRIKAGDLDEELLAHYEEEKRFRAAGQSPPAAASVVGTASPPRKRRSLEDNGTSPLGASALAPASPLPAGTDAPSSPLSPAQPPTKKARLEPPHAEDATAVVDTTTSTGVGRNGAPTEPPPAAPASPPAEAEAEPTKAVAEAAEPTAVESAEPQLESDQTLSSSAPLETPTMTAMMLGMVVEEPLPLPVVSSLSSAPASPASLAQQETWTQQPQLLPTPDDLAASLAYHDPLLVETSAPYANADAADAAESVELQPQPTAAEPNSRDAVEAAEPLRPAAGEVDAATTTTTAPPVTEDNAPPPPLVVSAATAPAEAAGPKQDSLAPTAAAPEGIKKDQPSPNAGASFSTDLLWENFETEALPTAGAGEKGDHDAMIGEAAKPPPADTKAGPQGETQTEMDVEAEAEAEAEAAASFNEEDDRGKMEVKEEREEAALETEKDETRRDDAKATEVEQADVEMKEQEQEEEEEEEEEPVVVEQMKPRGRPRRQSVNTAKRTYKRRKPAAEAEEKEAEAEAEAEVKTVVVIDDQDEDGVKVEDSASGEEAKKRPMKEKRTQQAKKETMKVKESEEEEKKKEAKDDDNEEEENKGEKTKNENEEEEESEGDDMEAEAEAAVRRVEMEGVRRVLATVKAHHYAKPFLQPVSVEDVPEYPKIIYRPMDFTTITNRIKTGVISSKIEFLRDMYLLFQNAFIFNPKGSDIYVMASTLKTLTKTEMREVDREVEVVRESFPPAARPKKNPVSAATKTATRRNSPDDAASGGATTAEPKKGANKESKKATTAAPRLAEANRKRRR